MDAATFARSVVSFAKSPKFNKGCFAKGVVSFRLFFFVTIFLFGAFFLHLILIILIDPDFNNEQQQQQKTLTEEKTL